jgi:hypothetical protein
MAAAAAKAEARWGASPSNPHCAALAGRASAAHIMPAQHNAGNDYESSAPASAAARPSFVNPPAQAGQKQHEAAFARRDVLRAKKRLQVRGPSPQPGSGGSTPLL